MLKAIGKDLDHKRTKAKQLVGAVEKTSDNDFEASRTKLENLIKTVNVLIREIQKLDEEISGYIKPIKSMSTDLNQFCAMDSSLMECAGNFENAILITDSTITNYLKVEQELQGLTKAVLEGLQIVKRKVAVRDEALLDVDKYRTKLKHAKDSNNAVLTEKYSRKFSNFQQQYDAINQELKIQIDDEAGRVNGYFISEIQKMYRRHYAMFCTLGEGFKAIADNEIISQVDSNSYKVATYITSYTGSESVSSPKPSSSSGGGGFGSTLKSFKRRSIALLATPFGEKKDKHATANASSTTTNANSASQSPPPRPKASPFNERPPGIPPPVQNTNEDDSSNSQYDSSQYPTESNPFEHSTEQNNYAVDENGNYYPEQNNPYDYQDQTNPYEQYGTDQNYQVDANGNYYYPEQQQQT